MVTVACYAIHGMWEMCWRIRAVHDHSLTKNLSVKVATIVQLMTSSIPLIFYCYCVLYLCVQFSLGEGSLTKWSMRSYHVRQDHIPGTHVLQLSIYHWLITIPVEWLQSHFSESISDFLRKKHPQNCPPYLTVALRPNREDLHKHTLSNDVITFLP